MLLSATVATIFSVYQIHFCASYLHCLHKARSLTRMPRFGCDLPLVTSKQTLDVLKFE